MTRTITSLARISLGLALPIISAALIPLSDVHAQPTPSPTAPKKVVANGDISATVGLNEIKLEMAESRFKLSQSPKAINDLVNAIEEYLTTNCMGKIFQTLSYEGNPTDPTCIARMERLLEINPTNPVAICLRDGIGAKSCAEAYQSQKVVPIYNGTSAADIDPALKVGLSAAMHERIQKVEESLKEVNKKYQAATDPEEKRTLVNDAGTLYDQALSMACKLSAVSLSPRDPSQTNDESTEIIQTRERLLQIPPAIRGDYQREMEKKVVEEMNQSTTTEDRKRDLKEVLAVIKDPLGSSRKRLSDVIRTRYILETCASLLKVAIQIVPDLPAVTCYRDGWHTPQCIIALKKWRVLKQQERSLAKGTPAPKAGTPSMISTF